MPCSERRPAAANLTGTGAHLRMGNRTFVRFITVSPMAIAAVSAKRPAAASAQRNGESRGAESRNADVRFDRRLGEILRHATDVFYEKGYEGASMRDLSR